jgi:phospholipase C
MPFNDSRIEHFVVLMLENRSFDHMLGFSGVPGIDGLTGAETNPDTTGAPVNVSNDAQYIGDYEPDPGHELFDVNVQIFSNQQAAPGAAPPMQGFIQSYFQVCNDPNRAKTVMKCFSPQTLPNLTFLAQHFAVCDRWFSSVPGPTLPNRSFAHAATSLGSAVGPPFLGNLHTIYPVLNQQQVTAKIYYQDFTMALTFKELLSDQAEYFGLFMRKPCRITASSSRATTPTTPAARTNRPTSIPTMTCATEKRSFRRSMRLSPAIRLSGRKPCCWWSTTNTAASSITSSRPPA